MHADTVVHQAALIQAEARAIRALGEQLFAKAEALEAVSRSLVALTGLQAHSRDVRPPGGTLRTRIAGKVSALSFGGIVPRVEEGTSVSCKHPRLLPVETMGATDATLCEDCGEQFG